MSRLFLAKSLWVKRVSSGLKWYSGAFLVSFFLITELFSQVLIEVLNCMKCLHVHKSCGINYCMSQIVSFQSMAGHGLSCVPKSKVSGF